MTNAKMHAIEVQDTPMSLQRSPPPVLKLLGEALVEATDRASTGSNTHEGFGDFTHLVSTRASYEHLGQALGHLLF